MLIKKLLLTILASFTMVLGVIAIVIACGGSPQPPACPQSIYLGKFAPSTLLIPPDGSAFTVPVGIFPFVAWDPDTEQCAQPASALVTFELDCTDITGATFDLGPEMFAQPLPGAPGAQGTATIDFPVPGGTLPSICTVMGTYEVDFDAGIGLDLAATGDTEVCLVEPSPSDFTFPRIKMELIQTDVMREPGVMEYHQGDQAYAFYKAYNNDVMRSATFNFFSEGTQVAGFPDGFDNDAAAYNAGVFRIADSNADVFPLEFFFDGAPLPFDLIPGDPTNPDPQRREAEFTLEPGEIEIFGLAMRSYGACADGSCNERIFCAEVELNREGFETDKAFACSQLVYVVNNSLPPTYPGLTVKYSLNTHADSEIEGSTVKFYDENGDLIDETHRVNKLDGRIQVLGDNNRQPPPFPGFEFPGTWDDQVTLPELPRSMEYDDFVFDSRDADGTVFFGEHSTMTVANMLPEDGDCVLPAISYLEDNDPAAPVFSEITVHLPDGCRGDSQVNVTVAGVPGTFQFALNALAGLEAFGFKVDAASGRTFSFPWGNNLNREFLVSDPPFGRFNLDDLEPFVALYNITDQFGNRVDFDAVWEGTPGVTPIVAGNGQLQAVVDPSVLQGPLDTIEGTLVVTKDGAINTVRIPIVIRRKPQQLSLDFEFNSPPLAQVGETYEANILIPGLDPQPIDPYFNMEFFIGIETDDDLGLGTSALPFTPIDGDTSEEEKKRLTGKFGEDPINKCTEGVWKCGKIDFGTGFEFAGLIFADGFESGDVNAWSTGAAADNSETKKKRNPVGVLNEEKKLPVISEEDLKEAIELFNDDSLFTEKTIGLVSDSFGVLQQLPPHRGEYFFDEFESFRKDGSQAPVTVYGNNCPSPCSGLVMQGAGGGVNGIRFEGFPDYGLVLEADSLFITRSEFVGNGAGGVQITGGIGDILGNLRELGNHFEGNAGPGIVVEGGSGHAFKFNTFTANGGLAIDLGGDGVTANDPGDVDTGPNDLQNFPVLSNVLLDASGTLVEGSLNSIAGTIYTLQFYANDACDPSGNGEGAVFLGETEVTTDANGDASFSFNVEGAASRGQFVTATATDPVSTSEFSACFEIVTGVATEGPEEEPTEFALDQNYPNPFNPATTITYAVPEASQVRLEVFDMLGRLVVVLVDEMRSAGYYEVVFDASRLSSGVYFYKMTGERFSQTKTLMLLK